VSDCSKCQASPPSPACTDPACPVRPPAHAPSPSASNAPRRARIIVLGNEKGGSGKSTTAMHVIVALLKQGFQVGSIDLDARQGTLSRMLENRAAYAASSGRDLALPGHRRIARVEAATRAEAEAAERAALDAALRDLLGLDFIVIDTPGSDSFLSRLGHAAADVLITPLNDSYLDLDLLARIDVQGRQVLGPSLYSQMVWEQRQQRALAGLAPMEWIVMRNRLSHIDARNKRDIGRLLELLGNRIGFRLAPGFGERVIFRELFPKGLTLLDLTSGKAVGGVAVSRLAAQEEVRGLLSAIGLDPERVPPEEVPNVAATAGRP
jgi:chromosome partitioning protein